MQHDGCCVSVGDSAVFYSLQTINLAELFSVCLGENGQERKGEGGGREETQGGG